MQLRSRRRHSPVKIRWLSMEIIVGLRVRRPLLLTVTGEVSKASGSILALNARCYSLGVARRSDRLRVLEDTLSSLTSNLLHQVHACNSWLGLICDMHASHFIFKSFLILNMQVRGQRTMLLLPLPSINSLHATCCPKRSIAVRGLVSGSDRLLSRSAYAGLV